MAFIHLSPEWFFGYNVAFELAFAIIALIVALFAFKIYKKSDQKQVQLFGISFLFISIAYCIQSIFNFLAISRLNEPICQLMRIQSLILLEAMGIYAHIIFMTIGLVFLLYMTLKTERLRTLWLLLIASLSAILFSENPVYIFFLLSTIYLAFISVHFISNYLKKKQVKTLLVALAFIFLLFGSAHFMFSLNHQTFYVISHFLELIAYLLILCNFYLVRKGLKT